MLEVVKYLQDNYVTDKSWELKRPTPELINACENILAYAKEHDMPYNVRPFVPKVHQYIKYLEKYHNAYGSGEFPAEKLEQSLSDEKAFNGHCRVMREIQGKEFPEDFRRSVLEAFCTQEQVFSELFMFRIVKQEPGDNITLHMDPKPFYFGDGNWIDGDYTDYNAQMFMHDRKPGQITWLEEEVVNYKKYDFIKYVTDQVYHGAGNMGWHDRYMIFFSWAQPNA